MSEGGHRANRTYVFDYDAETLREHDVANINDCIAYKESDSVTWINVDNVPPVSFLEELRLGFELHPVVVDDILTLHQRPKIEVLDKYVFVRLKTVRFDAPAKKMKHEQISIVLAPHFVMTFQQGVAGDPFDGVRDLIRKKGTRIRSQGTDYLCYELIESVVEDFFTVLEHVSRRIDELEQHIVRDPSAGVLHTLNTLKRELLSLRKAAWPIREIITHLERGDTAMIRETTRIYLRDSYTKLIQVTESIEIYREMISSLQDFYHLRVNSRTNEVMKLLTIIATIFMPLTLIVGFFGMNFTRLPALNASWAPGAVSLGMIALALGMLAFFKKKDWI